jgi:hypothetical protein
MVTDRQACLLQVETDFTACTMRWCFNAVGIKICVSVSVGCIEHWVPGFL